jgi:hypothetical protein
MGAVPLPAAAQAMTQADPREALYTETAAALAHQYEHTLASNQEALENDQTALKAGQGKLDQAEPLQLTGIRNRANAEGLLSSGIEAQRTGTQQTGYLTSRNQLQTNFQQQQSRINRANSEAGENLIDKLGTELAGAQKRQQAEAENQAKSNPTLGAPAPPPKPAAPAAVPRLQVVSQKAQPITSTPRRNPIRRAAARRVVG